MSRPSTVPEVLAKIEAKRDVLLMEAKALAVAIDELRAAERAKASRTRKPKAKTEEGKS